MSWMQRMYLTLALGVAFFFFSESVVGLMMMRYGIA